MFTVLLTSRMIAMDKEDVKITEQTYLKGAFKCCLKG